MHSVTVEETIETAIGAEQTLEEFFRGLKAKFNHNPEVSLLWELYAKDEAMHAKWLEALKAKLGQDELSKLVDEHTTQSLEDVVHFSVKKALDSIHNLEDACELVNEIESGETNAIFRFLIDNFEADVKMRDFLRGQLNRHVARLTTDLPPQYQGTAMRQKIKASA